MAESTEDNNQADVDNNDNENLNTDSIEDLDLTWIDKLKFFSSTYWRGVICLMAPVILITILTPFPPKKYQWCAYTLVLMAIYWVTECIPLAITSFLPIVIFPLTGVMDTSTTCACYMNDTVLMFLGSMILAAAVEQSGLHVRMALCAIKAIGYSHYRLLFALSFMTMFISMWITNTAATTMMVPINFAMLKVFEDQQLLTIYETTNDGSVVASDITTCYFCATTFSATIGGIGTLVGTATNLVFKGLFSRAYPSAPDYLTFPRFSAFTIPYMLVLEAAMYFCLVVVYFGFLRPQSKEAEKTHISQEGQDAAKQKVAEDWMKLGRISFWEIMVIILFSGAMLMFFCRSPKIFTGWEIEDLPKSPIPSVLSWTLLNSILPYSFMFLLGGGFALSEAAKPEHSDLNGKIGDFLQTLNSLPNCIIILLIIIFTVFITNFASNVAVCNVIAPIVMQLAQEVNRNPLWYNIAAGLSASYCFFLPVGTPGNLIVQGAANISTSQMMKAGFGPTITTILISWLAIYFWAPVIWPELHSYPDWIYKKD
ncbi:protein I'm not dead yet-like isoform X2 [Plodia interpunctella]|uniref:protein I'm not dead yet-like isoform X2 n=1 Tax=Plodia interpunctella TaxID=58824 RepID=UPI0023675F76|nr:protein I'm not dead yet-like isoform X2 [Plodia interpunctella]